MSDRDALHAARALLGGRPLNISTETLFARVGADPRISSADLRNAKRVFDAAQIGQAVEAIERTGTSDRAAVLLRLARAVRPYLANREPGWFRFLLMLGSQPGESMFHLSYVRRPRSKTSQPETALHRATHTRRALSSMAVAGAILQRIEAAKGDGRHLTVKAAIEASINSGDIATDEEAALKAWHGFRSDCEELTQGQGTYRLERYSGLIEKYRGFWVALPDTGAGLSRLPSEKGGRPKT